MDPNEDILKVFQELPEHRMTGLWPLMGKYKTACRLSQGTRLDKLAYRKERALRLERDLRKQLGLD